MRTTCVDATDLGQNGGAFAGTDSAVGLLVVGGSLNASAACAATLVNSRTPAGPLTIDTLSIINLSMLDRSQHLKLFLTGSGDTQADADKVIADKWVQEELARQPVNPERLFWVMRRVSRFEFNPILENQFWLIFGRYR